MYHSLVSFLFSFVCERYTGRPGIPTFIPLHSLPYQDISSKPTSATLSYNMKEFFLHTPFIVIFIAIFVLLTALSTALVSVVAEDPNDRAFSPIDMEGGIFLPPDSESESEVRGECGVIGSGHSGLQSTDLETMLAIHRERVTGRLSGVMTVNGYFGVDSSDVLDQGGEDEPERKCLMASPSKVAIHLRTITKCD